MKITKSNSSAFFSLCLTVVATNTLANDAAVLRCRAITESAARLACYDGINVSATSASSSSDQAAKANSPEQFGLKPKANPNEINTIESSIDGPLDGWQANTRIKLANGQVWQVSDDSSAFCNCDNKKVVVRRGPLGNYGLEIEGTNRSPRVKRVK
jgi:hypothetical protein